MPDNPDRAPTAQRVLTGMRRVERVLTTSAFVILVAIIFADVLSRELTGAGIYWASQTGVWANVMIVMAGFGIASAEGAHLRPRFADGWLPRQWLPHLETLQHGLMSLFCWAAALLALQVVIGSWRLGEVSLDLFVPVWPIQALLPLALAAAGIRHGIYAAYPNLRPCEAGALVPTSGQGERS